MYSFKYKVYGIIILYKPSNAMLLSTLQTYKTLNSNLLIVINDDNGESKFLNKNNISFISNTENIGIASALNQGIKYIIDNKLSDLVILLDQDSKISDDMINELLATFIKSRENHKIACVAPNVSDIKMLALINNTKQQPDKIINKAITSGMLIPIEVLKIVGLMDESLFIDGVDHEWCFRAKYFNYKIIQSQKAILTHNNGDKFINFFGIRKPIHKNPIRHYYIIRNSLILLRRRYIPLSWKTLELLKTIRRLFAYLIYSKSRKQTAFYLYKGVLDGLKNKTGRLD